MCGIAGLAYRRAHDFRQEAERRVQPMLSECGGYALNHYGELYNAVELRRLLEHEGAVFHSRYRYLQDRVEARPTDCLRLRGKLLYLAPAGDRRRAHRFHHHCPTPATRA